MAKKNIVVVGASRGLGLALVDHHLSTGNRVWGVSRSTIEAASLNDDFTHIAADLRNPIEASSAIEKSLDGVAIDQFIYCAGIWEKESFNKTPETELIDILSVCLTSFMLAVKKLDTNIAKAVGKIFAIGSTCGLVNEGANCVGYVAAKFGLRGACSALREYYRSKNVSVTCINPGSMATDFKLGEQDKALDKYKGERMPVEDLVQIIDTFAGLSASACPKELDLPALKDTDA